MSEVVTSYSVHYADWDQKPDPPEWDNLSQEDFQKVWFASEAEVSDTIDERTWRAVQFDSEEAALEFANKLMTDRADDKWLAVVEVRKHTCEVLKSLT